MTINHVKELTYNPYVTFVLTTSLPTAIFGSNVELNWRSLFGEMDPLSKDLKILDKDSQILHSISLDDFLAGSVSIRITSIGDCCYYLVDSEKGVIEAETRIVGEPILPDIKIGEFSSEFTENDELQLSLNLFNSVTTNLTIYDEQDVISKETLRGSGDFTYKLPNLSHGHYKLNITSKSRHADAPLFSKDAVTSTDIFFTIKKPQMELQVEFPNRIDWKQEFTVKWAEKYGDNIELYVNNIMVFEASAKNREWTGVLPEKIQSGIHPIKLVLKQTGETDNLEYEQELVIIQPEHNYQIMLPEDPILIRQYQVEFSIQNIDFTTLTVFINDVETPLQSGAVNLFQLELIKHTTEVIISATSICGKAIKFHESIIAREDIISFESSPYLNLFI